MAEFSLLTFNAKGIKDDDKRKLTFNWCKEKNADIYFLQETHSSINTEKYWEQNWDGPIMFSHGTTGAKGVAKPLTKP